MNLLTFGYGITTGWASPSILLLTSDDSPLPSGKIDLEEASWVASILSAGGLFGKILFGFITNIYGRKWPLLFLSVPIIVRDFASLIRDNNIYQRFFKFQLTAQLVWHLVCTERLSFVCGQSFEWFVKIMDIL